MTKLVTRLLVVVAATAAGVWMLGSTLPPRIDALPSTTGTDDAYHATPDHDRHQGQRRGHEVPSGPERDHALGVQLSAHHAATPKRALAVMDRLADAGAGWLRVDVGWATLQPDGPGPFADWYAGLLDDVLAHAQDLHLKVILDFWLTPPWASASGSPYAPPTHDADFAKAIGMAAQRWGDEVDAWEIWNEPNFDSFFEGADAETYTRLLCAAYPAVKHSDQSPVLLGGLMYNDDDWLRQVYEAGAKDCFDGVATHPYIGPSNAAPDTPAVGVVWRLTATPAVRDVMKEYGDASKRIWITELGWSSGPDSKGNPWDLPVSPRTQAKFLREAVELVRSRYPYVGPIIWYRDVDGPTRSYQDGFGLMHPDLSPKPAFHAFEAAVRGRGMRRPGGS
jgi:hypothetical protein